MKKSFRKLFALFLVLCLSLSLFPAQTALAKTTSQKIKDAQKQQKQLQQEIEEQQDEVSKLNKKKKKLQNELKKLNTELQETSEHINDLEIQIVNKEQEIVDTQNRLAEAKQTEIDQYESMKKRIQFMYEDSQSLYMDIIFQAKSFSDFLTLSGFVESLAGYDRQKFEEYTANRENIEALEAKLWDDKNELDMLKAEAEAEQVRITQVINETQAKVSEYADLIDDAEDDLIAYEKKLENLNGDIVALQAQLAEEIRLSQLAMTSTWRDISQVQFADSDEYLISVLIYCEAGGEPYEGQVAVGAVIMNRVLSSAYPNTVTGVVYQKNAFSPVNSGRLAKYLAIGKTTKSCIRAAQAAMSGYSNVGNCTRFRTPIDGLTGIQIGGHIFY